MKQFDIQPELSEYSSFRGAYFAKKICEIWDSVDMICCWMGSDWMSSYYDSRSFINGASGI